MSAEAFAEILNGGAEVRAAEPVREQAIEPQKLESMGVIEAATEGIKEAVQGFAPGLSLGKILGDIGHELSEMATHGAHEAAAALFNGSAFVMYPHAGQEQAAQSPATPEASAAPERMETLKDIIEAPTPPMTPSIDRDNGIER